MNNEDYYKMLTSIFKDSFQGLTEYLMNEYDMKVWTSSKNAEPEVKPSFKDLTDVMKRNNIGMSEAIKMASLKETMEVPIDWEKVLYDRQ